MAATVVSLISGRSCGTPKPDHRGLGQEPALARDAGIFLRGYMWTIFPFLLFQAMRHFLSALERPRWMLAISRSGSSLNALLG